MNQKLSVDEHLLDLHTDVVSKSSQQQAKSPGNPPPIPMHLERRWCFVAQQPAAKLIESIQVGLDVALPSSSRLASIDFDVNQDQFVVR